MSINSRSVSLNDSARASAVNHQVVTGRALSLGNVSYLEKMPFCMTATIRATNFLCYLHFATLVFQRVIKKVEKKLYSLQIHFLEKL